MNYDLSVYCYQCGGNLAGQSYLMGSSTDVVNVRWDDTLFVDDSNYIVIAVTFSDGSSPDAWRLQVQGIQLYQRAPALNFYQQWLFFNPRAESRRRVIVASEMLVVLNYLVERR